MATRRLLLVTDEMELGGSQRQIACLLSGLDRRRWEPELLYFRSRSFLVDALEADGVRVHHLAKRGRVDLRFVFAYARLLRRGRYDVVHAYSLTAELWTALARLLVRRPPLQVASIRNLHLTRSPVFWWLKRFALARSAAVISNSRVAATAAAGRLGIDESRFEFVANGISAPEPLSPHLRAALRREVGVPPGRVFGLFVGRLVDQKNLPCLVAAMARLPPSQRPWVAIAGEGPRAARVQQLRDEAGLVDDLRLLGSRGDAMALMAAADFLVLPSFHEGMPNVVMEAMVNGCPVVASAVGGTPELVEDGVNGLLFPSNDDGALADCLARIGSDHALRARLAAACADVRRTYSVQRLVTATTRIYDRVLREARAAVSPARRTRRGTAPRSDGSA